MTAPALRDRLQRAIDRMAGVPVLVAADLVLDIFEYGAIGRISREAPVLILRFTEREVKLGGAANAVHNVHALGATAVPVGVLGTDGAGTEVERLFIAETLRSSAGNREEAAKTLGIGERTLYRKIKEDGR